MDVKMLGIEASSKFETDVSTRKNTVYAFFIQQLFTVNVDLQGYKPIQGLFNSSFTVSDLENLGNSNELGFDNLPTYVDSVTFGRILIFSVTSTASSVELKQAVDLKYDGNGGSLSNRLKYIIDNSEIRVFSYGGPFEPTAQAIKDGSYLSYFNSTNVPRNLAKPIGYTTRLWNDDSGPMYRTTEYTTRNCAPIHDITVRLSEVYDNASLYVSPMGTGSEVYVGTTDEDATWDITNRLTDSTDILRISNQGNRKGFPPNWQRVVRLEVRVDGELMISDKRDCKWCNSTSEAFKVRANRVTGLVELM